MDELESYKQRIKKHLDQLRPIFAKAAIGDFSQKVEIPEKDDEFSEIYAGIQIMLEVINYQLGELKRANELLAEKVEDRTEQLKYIIENSTNLFYIHDTNHVLNYVSPQSRDFFGVEPKEAMRRWTEFATDNPINEIGLKHTERAIRTGIPQPSYELELFGKGGKKIWVQVNEGPALRKGKVIGIVGSLTNITEQKAAANKIRKRTEDLEKINRFMIGRENKMVELKKEIAKLKKELDECRAKK